MVLLYDSTSKHWIYDISSSVAQHILNTRIKTKWHRCIIKVQANHDDALVNTHTSYAISRKTEHKHTIKTYMTKLTQKLFQGGSILRNFQYYTLDIKKN